MENTGFKGLLVTLYQRVILSYKSTLIGIAILAGTVIAENLVNSPNKILTTIGAILAAVLAMVKSPTLQDPKPPTP